VAASVSIEMVRDGIPAGYGFAQFQPINGKREQAPLARGELLFSARIEGLTEFKEMTDKPAHKSWCPDAHDYRAAIAKAVEWLGDRYLLAKPMKSSARHRQPRQRRADIAAVDGIHSTRLGDTAACT